MAEQMIHPIIKTSFIIGYLGAFFLMIGMAVPAWMNDPDRRVSAGLYRICFTSDCVSYDYQGGALYTSRAFIMIAFFCAVAGLVGGVVYYRKYFFNSIENRKLVLASAVLYFVSAGVGFLGAIIFSTAGVREVELFIFYALSRDLSFSVSFSLGLGMVGILSSAGAGILTVIHIKKELEAQGTTPNPIVLSNSGAGYLTVVHTEKELAVQGTVPHHPSTMVHTEKELAVQGTTPHHPS